MSTTLRIPTLTALTLLLTLAGSAAQAGGPAYLEIKGIPGEFTEAPVSGFEIKFGSEPHAALLVPAVQKIREARLDLAGLACDGAVLPLVIVHVSRPGSGPFLRYEMTNALITSYGMRGGLDLHGGGQESAPMEEVAFNYTKIAFFNLETGESFEFDCASGQCSCAR